MESAVDVRNISKFNGQNFQLWKFQIKTVLVANELLDIVEGRTAKPEAEGAPQTDWIKRNAKDMFILSSSIEFSQLEYLITCTTSHDMWTKLSSILEQKSATNKLALITKFHEYQMHSGDTVAQHIETVENLANQLKDIDQAGSDTMIMAKIQGSLPGKFHPFVSAWESVLKEN